MLFSDASVASINSYKYPDGLWRPAQGPVVDDTEFEVFKGLHTKTVFQYPESLDEIVWVTGEDLKALKTMWT